MKLGRRALSWLLVLVLVLAAAGYVVVTSFTPTQPRGAPLQAGLASPTFGYTSATVGVLAPTATEPLSRFQLRWQVDGSGEAQVPMPTTYGFPGATVVLGGASRYNVTVDSIRPDGSLRDGDRLTILAMPGATPQFRTCTFALLWTDGSQIANVTFVWPPYWSLGASWNLNGQAVTVFAALPDVPPAALEVQLQVNGTNGTLVPLPTTPRIAFEVPVGSVNYSVMWQNQGSTGMVSAGDWFQIHYAVGPSEVPVGTPMAFVLLREGFGIIASVGWSAQTHG